METPTIDYSNEIKEEENQASSPMKRRLVAFFKATSKTPTDIESEKIQRADYIRAKTKLNTKYKKRGLVSHLTTFVVMFILLSITMPSNEEFVNLEAKYGSRYTSSSIVVLSIVGTYVWHLIWQFEKSLREEIVFEYELSHAQDEAEENLFQNSIKTSYKYLDRYYDETQKQAQQGFRITVFIAVCGAALIFCGVIAMYFGKIEPAYITCASGAITELISAIFFYLYNKTVTSMSRYHNKLVLSQNISFALRVADSLENNKDAAKLEIIKELMKDVNAQMMKSDADDTEPPKKKPSPDAETPSGNE